MAMTTNVTTVETNETASVILDHSNHEGFAISTIGGKSVNIHVFCNECDEKYIIENVPQEKAKHPREYLSGSMRKAE